MEVWPGHVRGPLGGVGGASQKDSQTLGLECGGNPMLAIRGEDAFDLAARHSGHRAALAARPLHRRDRRDVRQVSNAVFVLAGRGMPPLRAGARGAPRV